MGKKVDTKRQLFIKTSNLKKDIKESLNCGYL